LGFTSTKHSGPDVGGKQTFGVRIEECTQNPQKTENIIYLIQKLERNIIFSLIQKYAVKAL